MTKRRVFFAMPFRPELNFFYLYLRQHLQDRFGLAVERGDAAVLTRPLMDKIREQILRADLVIGDVTGTNANVFYELGLAHANGKPVLFITQDPPDRAPVDIRQFEFIQYDLARENDLLTRLDDAVQNVFRRNYEALLERAREYLVRFNSETGLQCRERRLEDFQSLVMRGEQTGGIPSEDRPDLLAQFLLPKIIDDFTDAAVIRMDTEWTARLPPRPPASGQ